MLRMGDFSKLTSVMKKTLRHYDHLGLLKKLPDTYEYIYLPVGYLLSNPNGMDRFCSTSFG